MGGNQSQPEKKEISRYDVCVEAKGVWLTTLTPEQRDDYERLSKEKARGQIVVPKRRGSVTQLIPAGNAEKLDILNQYSIALSNYCEILVKEYIKEGFTVF
jgi:hypothetical protein